MLSCRSCLLFRDKTKPMSYSRLYCSYLCTTDRAVDLQHSVYKEMANADAPAPWMQWEQYDIFPGSFEKCSLLTAALTNLGLYLLMFLGFVNQLLFKPKVATERNREVSVHRNPTPHSACGYPSSPELS
ncbi:jg21365 [Pararge aegeria aegeria]|uniref:Jg21365 protein n=1 Tax=Pararge aegeria aegeria TaxID=348720 RepID=A0A8S4QVT9_9NEOP|nr:jg21365 [Pararge aegeria aegeria]